ncbi:MAG: tRNA (adenosine(37)-N6)-threonylcarbamoyltransferase complex ATPase subunit type 1 TsaE [Nitrospiraceae bacterium]
MSTVSSPWEYDSKSATDTDRLGQTLGRALHGGETIALYGDLGTGKTAFVRGIAAGLDAPRRAVTSPTFVFIHTYAGRLPMAHADLYRLESPAELRHLGLEEYFDDHMVVAVEWAEKAPNDLPADRLEVHFLHVSTSRRRIQFRTTGPRSRRLLKRITATPVEPESSTLGREQNKRAKRRMRAESTTSRDHRGTERRR